MSSTAPIHLRLPGTSANLGPGFDALGLAMEIALHIKAEISEEFLIVATGRNALDCGNLEDNLIINTYRSVLAQQGIDGPALRLLVHNEIPLGMGCGSSAAALVAGVALAAHFGDLKWDAARILTEASLREGHPDNVAACVLGGFTVSGMQVGASKMPPVVTAVALRPRSNWQILLVMPEESLSTSKARAILPETYSRADAVANIQNVALLTAAFAEGRGDLLRVAMRDYIHQPYRSTFCALLPPLLPMVSHEGVLGVALSGAGPSVLLLLEEHCDTEVLRKAIKDLLGGNDAENPPKAELLLTKIGVAAVLGI